MFKRRNPRSYWESFKESIYPKSGWRRAINYFSLRLKRLPDSPHRIALGFACGAFVCFSPFFGLHFFMAAFLAFVLRGNILASLIGTFFGNPITFPIIAAISYRSGVWILGYARNETVWQKLQFGFSDIFNSVWGNIKAIFGYEPTSWQSIVEFFNTIMVPYMVGGLAPGFVTALVIYFGSKPLIEAYQNRRKGVLMAKIKEIRERRQKDTDEA